MSADDWSPPTEKIPRPSARHAMFGAMVVPFLLFSVSLIALIAGAFSFIPGIDSPAPGNPFLAVYTVLVLLSVAVGAASLVVGLRRLGWTTLACGVTTLLYSTILFVALFVSGLVAVTIWVGGA